MFLNVILTLVGVLGIILIARVYGLYRTLKVHRSIMSPMLLAGIFFALMGVTELLEAYLGEWGGVIHDIAMVLGGATFVYGLYGYHQMLRKTAK